MCFQYQIGTTNPFNLSVLPTPIHSHPFIFIASPDLLNSLIKPLLEDSLCSILLPLLLQSPRSLCDCVVHRALQQLLEGREVQKHVLGDGRVNATHERKPLLLGDYVHEANVVAHLTRGQVR